MRDIKDLVTHRPPLLLLDSVRETGKEFIETQVRVDPAAWYADANGDMPAWFGVELMAQTVAAYSGAAKAPGEEPAIGYLLGTRVYTATVPVFPAGAELRVMARLHYLDDTGLSAFQCRILLDGEEVATALLKTFEDRTGRGQDGPPRA